MVRIPAIKIESICILVAAKNRNVKATSCIRATTPLAA